MGSHTCGKDGVCLAMLGACRPAYLTTVSCQRLTLSHLVPAPGHCAWGAAVTKSVACSGVPDELMDKIPTVVVNPLPEGIDKVQPLVLGPRRSRARCIAWALVVTASAGTRFAS